MMCICKTLFQRKKKSGEKHKDRKQNEEEKDFKKNAVVLYLV
jgi:hypothetical protein